MLPDALRSPEARTQAARHSHQQAEAELRRGRLPQAIAACSRALALNPSDAPALLTWGQLQQLRGRPDLARKAYERAIRHFEAAGDSPGERLGDSPAERLRDRHRAAAWGNLAGLHERAQDWAAAVDAYQKALAIAPELTALYGPLVAALDRLDREAAADDWRDRWLAQEPEALDPRACGRLGNRFLARGDADRAIAQYRRALARSPEAALVVALWVNLGNAWLQNEQWDKAAEAYRQAILQGRSSATVLDATLAAAWAGLGKARFSSGDAARTGAEAWDEAAEALERAVALDPQVSWTHHDLGQVYRQQERWDEAAAAYRRAIARNPQFVWSRFNLADVLARQERWAEAIAAYREALALDAGASWIWAGLGDALAVEEDWAEAIAAYRTAIARHEDAAPAPEDAAPPDRDFAWLHLKLGNALAGSGDWTGAIDTSYRAIAADPDDATLHRAIAAAYEGWIARNPEVAVLHYNRGNFLRHGQEWNAAIAAYRQAIALDPSLTLPEGLSDFAYRDGFAGEMENRSAALTADLAGRFCARPFQFLEVADNGDAFACCPGWLPKPLGNLETSTLSEVWNSPSAQAIRASILDGSFRYCRAKECPAIGKGTLPVREAVTDPELRRAIDENRTVLDRKPQEMNLAYDRSCNLSCPSCRVSTIVIQGEELDRKRQLQERLLADGLGDLEFLIVTGSGDPFASSLYRELLASLDARDYPKLRVHLMTNAQLFVPSIWEKWQKLHPAIRSVQISIDAATPETYRLVRRGGEFDRLLENLKFVSQLRREGPIQSVSLEYVVQWLNYREMPAFVRLGRRFGFDRVNFNGIRNWGTFAAKTFDRQAIHHPAHPEHAEFLAVLRDPMLAEPQVGLGNLAGLHRQAHAPIEASSAQSE